MVKSGFIENVFIVVDVFVVLVILAVGVFPFGIRPLFTDRILRKRGVTVKARCAGEHYRSEGQVSEKFNFRTLEGQRFTYRSPLWGPRVSEAGEILDIVYDPKSPSRRVRTVRELEQRSWAWVMLWGGLACIILMQLMTWGVLAFVDYLRSSMETT
ncbi:hypothetical protein [Streptomyces luteireticuli]|uniref:hypothetical protein n=1 Tax=Streptomyces luteireticuli TaxID=173858 RepID=UPI003558BA87